MRVMLMAMVMIGAVMWAGCGSTPRFSAGAGSPWVSVGSSDGATPRPNRMVAGVPDVEFSFLHRGNDSVGMEMNIIRANPGTRTLRVVKCSDDRETRIDFRLDQGLMSVVGPGPVVVLDPINAEWSDDGSSVDGVRMAVMWTDDIYDLHAGELTEVSSQAELLERRFERICRPDFLGWGNSPLSDFEWRAIYPSARFRIFFTEDEQTTYYTEEKRDAGSGPSVSGAIAGITVLPAVLPRL